VDRERGQSLRSGELARRAGVSPDTLRSYERRGLLPEARRAANGYRMSSIISGVAESAAFRTAKAEK